MKLIHISLLLGAAFVSSEAFLFNRREKKPAISEIKENCTQLASQGNCDFYNCFNNRHECREFLVGKAHDLCVKLEQRRPQFTIPGQIWLRNNTNCIMEELVPLYRSSELNCDDLTDAGYDSYQSCALAGKPNVCDIFWANAEHFMAVTDMRSMRSAKHAVSTMARCGLHALRRFIRYLTSHDIEVPSPFDK